MRDQVGGRKASPRTGFRHLMADTRVRELRAIE